MIPKLASLLFLLILTNSVRAELLIESLDGPVTQQEIDAFKKHMPTVEVRGDNNHNNMVYGRAGNAAEALGRMYEITQDRDILNQLITVADKMLAGRNDPETGKMIWTGKRDIIWPNNVAAAEPQGGSTEQGDVLAHIALAARCILQTKPLWNEKLNGDETYLDHAKKLIRECDRTVDGFILVWLVDKKTNLYTFPTSDLWAKQGDREARGQGKPVPWNQQQMLNGGFLRLAECHEILGDDPARVAKYDSIVKASNEDFLADLTHYDVNGHDCVKWSYVKEGKTLHHVEDTPHGGYDMLILRVSQRTIRHHARATHADREHGDVRDQQRRRKIRGAGGRVERRAGFSRATYTSSFGADAGALPDSGQARAETRRERPASDGDDFVGQALSKSREVPGQGIACQSWRGRLAHASAA